MLNNQIKFETSKVFGVFVMLPDGASNISVAKTIPYSEPIIIFDLPIGTNNCEKLPNGIDWNFEGFVSELTDEQKEGVVERVTEDLANKNDIVYRHYMDDGSIKIDPITKSKTQIIGFYECGNHLEALRNSFASLLTSLNVLLVNPYGIEPSAEEKQKASWMDSPITDETRRLWDWQTAQLQVGQWILLTANK